MPFTAGSANMRFSDRQAAVIPRSNSNARVFAQQQPNPVQRGQLNQGAASRAQNGPATTQNSRGQGTAQSNDAAGWRRFGSPSGQGAAGQGNQPSVNRNGSGTSGTAVRNSPSSASPQGGWQRFGAPGGSGSAPSQGQSPAGSRQNYGSSPNSPGQRYNAPGGGSGQSLRIAPNVVRQRPSYSAPSYSAPRQGAPSYSAPRQSAPSYSAPRSSGGGSAPHASSGGGHSGHGR
jgi:hypothetical protein